MTVISLPHGRETPPVNRMAGKSAENVMRGETPSENRMAGKSAENRMAGKSAESAVQGSLPKRRAGRIFNNEWRVCLRKQV